MSINQVFLNLSNNRIVKRHSMKLAINMITNVKKANIKYIILFILLNLSIMVKIIPINEEDINAE